MGLTGQERKVLGDISKERFWKDVEWFTAKGEKLSGTPPNEESVDYILDSVKTTGLNAQAPEFQAWLGFPNLFNAEAVVQSPERRALNCVALAQCASGEAEGELVYAGGGGLADYKELNARNKIVLVDFHKPPARPWKNYVAGVLKGALGLIVISYRSPVRVLNRGTVKSVWGNPIPENIDEIGRIPAVIISREDGDYLLELLAKGPVQLSMKADGLRGFYRTRQPMARVSGESPHFVLLGSHMDAWAAAGSCNALGVASTLEAARVMKKNQSTLKRGVQLLWFQGHETGIMSGSSWYLDNYWDDVNRNCVAYLNNDTTNMIYSKLYAADGDPVLRDFITSTVRELAEEEGAEYKEPASSYFPTKYGDQSFYGVGVPSGRIHLGFTPEDYEKVVSSGGWWYHSEYDTLDKCDPETMYMAEKAQTLVILRLCTYPVLPYKIERLADWTIDALTALKTAAKDSIDLGSLHEEVRLFKEKAAQLDEATAGLAVGKISQREKVEAANSGLMRISRIMNPINYTMRGRYDQDYYGAEYVKPIPILQPVAELASLNPDATEYKTLKTKLVRARNQVMDAVKEAEFITDYTLVKSR